MYTSDNISKLDTKDKNVAEFLQLDEDANPFLLRLDDTQTS